MSELLKWKQTACEAAQKASALLLSMRQNFSVREKARFDLVTDADTASQKIPLVTRCFTPPAVMVPS